jgi:glycosyltransferase involved in cell wall biosynthesis
LPTAYVLLNTEIGSEREVLHTIKGIEGVQEAFGLWGIYDIIARVKADTMGQAGRHLVEEKYSWKKVALQVERIYREAAEDAQN